MVSSTLLYSVLQCGVYGRNSRMREKVSGEMLSPLSKIIASRPNGDGPALGH